MSTNLSDPVKRLSTPNSRGLIPGPSENEEDFWARVSDNVNNHEPALDFIEELFEVRPDWIPVTFTNNGLWPWEGGAVEVEPTFHLYIRKHFAQKERYLALYNREEIVAHEFVHGVRCAFDEDEFEEILAYRTSRSRLRRFFGPLLRPKESLWLVTSCVLCWLSPYFLLLTAFILGRALVRLVKNQRTFTRCLRHLQELGLPPLPVALRLTDAEIRRFAKAAPAETLAYIKAQDSLRWKQLTLLVSERIRILEGVA